MQVKLELLKTSKDISFEERKWESCNIYRFALRVSVARATLIVSGNRTTVTGMLLTSWPHTSHMRSPLIPNHFTAHSLCAKASSPRQLHSIFKVSPYSSVSASIQILQTASSSGIASSESPLVDPDPAIIRWNIYSFKNCYKSEQTSRPWTIFNTTDTIHNTSIHWLHNYEVRLKRTIKLWLYKNWKKG